MIIETGLKCVVSGSFDKYKPEIDRTIEEFRDLGVTVLAPDIGWIAKPRYQILSPGNLDFRPLPSEQGMSVRQIEDGFLFALSKSSFQYVESSDGYVGNIVSIEIGFALASGVLVFSRQQISPFLDLDPMWKERTSQIEILAPQQVVKKLLNLQPWSILPSPNQMLST